MGPDRARGVGVGWGGGGDLKITDVNSVFKNG